MIGFMNTKRAVMTGMMKIRISQNESEILLFICVFSGSEILKYAGATTAADQGMHEVSNPQTCAWILAAQHGG
jgi:hypothetical protein